MGTLHVVYMLYGEHPGGRRAGGQAETPAGGGRADTPAGGGQADTPAGAMLHGGIRPYAMGEGGYGGNPIGEAGRMYQQASGHGHGRYNITATRYTRMGTCVHWGMADTYNCYKTVM